MTALVWDQIGERSYETGVDHGVLYLPDDVIVVWNGLVSITENRARETKSYYLDGVKYLEHQVPGAYSAKVQAFTYPDELESVLGSPMFVPGVRLHDQTARRFHMTYRTGVANDVDGMGHGYRIHIVYNVTASPGDAAFNSLAGSVSGTPFDWELRGVPNWQPGIPELRALGKPIVRAVGHISLDSRTIDPVLLGDLETVLYGSEYNDPSMPELQEILDAVGS